MAIIIKKIDDKHWLYSVHNTPINLTPFTNPSAIENFQMFMGHGEIKDLNGLEVDKEYELEWLKDFEVVERTSQVVHEDGLVYDDLVYKLKTNK